MERKAKNRAASRLSKVLVKVTRDGAVKWTHFCYVSSDLYKAFFETVKCEKSEFGFFLSVWARGDFSANLKMSKFRDIQTLKALIKRKYEEEYPELYVMNSEENPKLSGLVRVWISQHMRQEIAIRKENPHG